MHNRAILKVKMGAQKVLIIGQNWVDNLVQIVNYFWCKFYQFENKQANSSNLLRITSY
jgi:hypothetical protein